MKKLETDRIIGISAMIISLLTLSIFIYQTTIIREQSRLSVTPRLAFNTNFEITDSVSILTLRLINKGLGPGIIESVSIIDNNDILEFDFNFYKFFEEAYPEFLNGGQLSESGSIGEGSTLSPNESYSLFSIEYSRLKTSELLNKISNGEDFFTFNIEVEYSSIYKEHWKISTNDEGHPRKL